MKLIKILLIGLALFTFVIAQDTTVVNKIKEMETEYNKTVDSYVGHLRLQQNMSFAYREMKKLDTFSDVENAQIAKLGAEFDSVGVLLRNEKLKLDNLRFTFDLLKRYNREPVSESKKKKK